MTAPDDPTSRARTLPAGGRVLGFLAALLCLAIGASPALAQGAGPASRPNIVLVVADDLGYADVGCFGSQTIATPRIDAAAAEGARLTSFYTHPTCTPTRAALLTGKYAQRNGIDGPIGIWAENGLASTEVTLAEALRARGYRTGFFGKWHLGDSPEQLPVNQGFDDWFGTPWGLIGRPDVLMDSMGPDEWSGDLTTWTRRFTDRTLAFIDDSVGAGQPFFAVLAHHVPHYPVTPGVDFIGTSADGREYGDAVEEMDAGFGELLDRLLLHGVADDTLLLFMSDNGPTDVFGAYQAGFAGPFRGRKGQTWEGGVRVPCVVRWPARVPVGIDIASPIHAVDLMPTLLSILDGPQAMHAGFDGRNVTALLEGGSLAYNEDIVYYPGFGTGVDGVRRGDYKLRNGALYDLASDPGETTDLAASLPALAADLDALRLGLEIDLGIGAQVPEATSRRRPTWRGELGLGPVGASTLIDGQTWVDAIQGWAPFVVVDPDPAHDFVRTKVPPDRPLGSPSMAVVAPVGGVDMRLERTGSEFLGLSGGPCSLGLWLRVDSGGSFSPGVVLDIGDADRGVSWTIANLGLIGDDFAPGRIDDLRIRVGGAASPGSAILDLDLPNDGLLHHVAVTVDSGGEVILFFDAHEQQRASAGGAVHWGGEQVWALLGTHGDLGASGGPGPAAPATTEGIGEVAGVRAWDRAISRYEVEAEYSRYNAYRYCGGQQSSHGSEVVLELRGSFLIGDQALEADVTGLPSGTVGILLVGDGDGRGVLGLGYGCVGGALRRLGLQFNAPGSTSVTLPVLDDIGPNSTSGWNPMPGERWYFQYVYRDGAEFRPSSAESVLFGF